MEHFLTRDLSLIVSYHTSVCTKHTYALSDANSPYYLLTGSITTPSFPHVTGTKEWTRIQLLYYTML